jgi:hypothetical protein
VVPLYCRKPATKGRRLLCAAADASLLPYVHSVSLCAPQSGFLAPARLLPGLFLKRVNDKGEARPIFRIQSTARRRGHVALRKVNKLQAQQQSAAQATDRSTGRSNCSPLKQRVGLARLPIEPLFGPDLAREAGSVGRAPARCVVQVNNARAFRRRVGCQLLRRS